MASIHKAKVRGRPPAWARRVWPALPPQAQAAVLGKDAQYAANIHADILEPKNVAHIYICFAHSGLYIGKCSSQRRSGIPSGIAARAMEHLRALRLPATRDGKIARYRLLRVSLGSVAYLPVYHFASEVRALAMEASLIGMLDPQCNGLDVAQLRATTQQADPHLLS